MSRLADIAPRANLLLPNSFTDAAAAWLREGLREATVFVIDNVADYYNTGAGKELHAWRLTDFPCVTPPMNSVWMEFRPRQHWASFEHDAELPAQVGLLLRTYAMGPDGRVRPGWPVVSDARWWVIGVGFEQWPSERGALYVVPPVSFYIRDDGVLLAADGNATDPAIEWFLGADDRGREMWQAACDIRTVSLVYPTLLALSFLHCANVTRTVVEPPPKLSRAHSRRYGAPLASYYTLQIDPMREVLRREGGSGQTGLRRALHICRGHFAQYTDRPLFGRLTGTFWRPAHVRGQARDRVVIKDYAVAAPTAERSPA